MASERDRLAGALYFDADLGRIVSPTALQWRNPGATDADPVVTPDPVPVTPTPTGFMRSPLMGFGLLGAAPF